MYSIERIETLITNSEESLARYDSLLRVNPSSIFYKGAIKNTIELLNELRHNLSFEKQKREKEIIDIRLKGKVAKVGKLPLELLGVFAKSLSECFIESSRKYQYGNKSGNKILSSVKNTIDLRFDRLIPGSTHILITGNTSPDLFGNSMIENGLMNTFGLLNVNSPNDLIEKSEILGGNGIKKLNDILNISLQNELEFDLEWESPNSKHYKWEGSIEKIRTLTSSISKLEINDPQEIEFTGILNMQSLKGQIEIQEDNSKPIKIAFPMSLLENVKTFQIGDTCNGTATKRIFKNTFTGEEKISYELVSLF